MALRGVYNFTGSLDDPVCRYSAVGVAAFWVTRWKKSENENVIEHIVTILLLLLNTPCTG